MSAPTKNISGSQGSDRVVILHGIGRSRRNMVRAQRAIIKGGYETLNISYPSRDRDLSGIACFVHEALFDAKVWDKPGRVHFVTHSMGGLVAQRYLEDYRSLIPQEKMGRVVMIAPPNGGSEVADLLTKFPPYTWIYGPAGAQLTTSARRSVAINPWYEVGIIAGTKGWPYVVAGLLIEGDHDGRVAVENAKLPGMKDFIKINGTHTFISWKPEVHKQVIDFIRNGAFTHDRP